MTTAEFMEIMAITRVIFIKSLWWIIPTIGWLIISIIAERRDWL